MHALSTQSKPNMRDDVNYFPIEALWEKWGAASKSPLPKPPFNIFRAEWHVNDYQILKAYKHASPREQGSLLPIIYGS